MSLLGLWVVFAWSAPGLSARADGCSSGDATGARPPAFDHRVAAATDVPTDAVIPVDSTGGAGVVLVDALGELVPTEMHSDGLAPLSPLAPKATYTAQIRDRTDDHVLVAATFTTGDGPTDAEAPEVTALAFGEKVEGNNDYCGDFVPSGVAFDATVAFGAIDPWSNVHLERTRKYWLVNEDAGDVADTERVLSGVVTDDIGTETCITAVLVDATGRGHASNALCEVVRPAGCATVDAGGGAAVAGLAALAIALRGRAARRQGKLSTEAA